MNQCRHLVYISRSVRLMTNTELVDLLEQARERNKKEDLTGLLLYKDLSFLQVLEGQVDAIDRVFESIKQDDRHFRVKVLIENEPINERYFSNWAMGFQHIDHLDIEEMEGYSHFFSKDYVFKHDQQEHTQILKLLDFFRHNS